MKQLKSIIQDTLSSKKAIDWLILHDIAKCIDTPLADVELSFIDGKERLEEPFKTCQGYISVVEKSFTAFSQIIHELTTVNQNNIIALSNLFVVITRYGGHYEEQSILENAFKECIGDVKSKMVFTTLIKSLNEEYYKDNNSLHSIKPDTLAEWLHLFRSVQYLHSLSDPLVSSLCLVKEHGRDIDYDLLINMNPLLRAVLVSQYGFTLQLSDDELKYRCNDGYGLSLIMACLLSRADIPSWLSQELINVCIENFWEKIGKQMFNYTFGLNYRNRNENEVYTKLKDLLHNSIILKMTTSAIDSEKCIATLSFPHDFIALSSWLEYKKDAWEKIPYEVKPYFIRQFISELQRIVKTLPTYFSSEKYDDPFLSFQLHERKYKAMLAYVLLFLSLANDDELKSIKNVCYKFKPLFYGGYKAVFLAKNFSTIMLLISLSGESLYNLSDEEWNVVKKYIKGIAQTILIPYIHISERDQTIWEDDIQKKMSCANVDLCLVKDHLCRIQNSDIREVYKEIFDTIEDTKIAKWKYEK